MPKSCSIDKCARPARARGMCSAHYQRMTDGVSLDAPLKRRVRGTLIERFWSYVDQAGPVPAYAPELGPCWLWTGGLMRNRYAAIRDTDAMRNVYAHRLSWELAGGTIPADYEVDHLCRVRHCVNPAHLEPVTHAENVRRERVAITRCPQGHPYNEQNTRYRANGDRVCKQCDRDRHNRAYAARSATKAQQQITEPTAAR